MQGCNKFIGVRKDFVWDERDKVETGDQAAHLVFLLHLDAQFLFEQVVHEMCTAASCHEFDTLSHVLYRDAVDGSRTLDEFSEEANAVVDVVCLEFDKVETSSRQGCR